MDIILKKFASLFMRFALIAYLFVAFFGISQTMMGMEKRGDGTMNGCMLSGTNICTMTFQEHLAHWQSMFTATAPQKALAFALIILLAVVFMAVAIFKRSLYLLLNCHTTRSRLYIKHNPHLSLFDPIKEALSGGILNPKIFESAIV